MISFVWSKCFQFWQCKADSDLGPWHRAGFKVCVVDPAPLAAWPNNYGVWCDEFEAMGLDDCFEVVWPQAQVFLDSPPSARKSVPCPLLAAADTTGCGRMHGVMSGGGCRFLQRPYARVDRPKLKRRLLESCALQGLHPPCTPYSPKPGP